MMEPSQKKQAALQIEKELLKELLRVCKENGINCYVDGGTLLGAVRHKGYIPWDDDIDVIMKREDYNRFIEIAPFAFKSPIIFQSYKTDVEYYHPHIQLRYEGTAGFNINELYTVKFHQGIFIDIFPLDRIENNIILNFIQWVKVKFWRKTINLIYGCNESNGLKLIFHKISYGILKDILTVEYLQNKITKACSSASGKNKKATLLCINSYRNQNLLDLAWFDSTIYLDFDELKVPAPEKYDNVLKAKYGDDYMVPQNSNTLHGRLVLDSKKSYKEYIEEKFREQ